jgi:hypothetical protein
LATPCTFGRAIGTFLSGTERFFVKKLIKKPMQVFGYRIGWLDHSSTIIEPWLRMLVRVVR